MKTLIVLLKGIKPFDVLKWFEKSICQRLEFNSDLVWLSNSLAELRISLITGCF